jgi:hypothetical protein
MGKKEVEHGPSANRDPGLAVRKRPLIDLVKRALFPGPHGESPSAIHELWEFSRFRWRKQFAMAGFNIVDEYPAGIFYTGYLLPPARTVSARRQISRVLGSACRVFVVKPQTCS